MKDKERLSMYVDITRITITLCWIALIAFWCLKLFGGNWFEIMVENENFLKFSDLVQNTWLKHIASLFTVSIGNYFMLGAISQKIIFKGKTLILVIFSIVSIWFVSNFVPMSFIQLPFWYGYFVLIIFGIIQQKGWKRCFGLFAIILEFLFSTISLITRNIDLSVISNYLIGYVLSIDVYLMIILYCLYTNLIKIKEGENKMIVLGYGWLGKAEAQEKGYNSFKRFCHNVRYALSFKWAKKTK